MKTADHYEESINALAHEIWAAAQLAPGEGIVDGVYRIVGLLRKVPHPAITFCENCGCSWLDDGLNPIGCPYCGIRRETERELKEWIERGRTEEEKAAALKQPAAVDEAKETDLWRCTVCGRMGTVGRCCGEETRERANIEQLLAEYERLRREVEEWRSFAEAQVELHDKAEDHAEDLAKALAELIANHLDSIG